MTYFHSEALLRLVDSFPALPDTVNKVIAVTSNPESSAHDLMVAVLPDQSMCATILKIANSAFFGIPNSVSTIEKAVVVLGFDEIRDVVISKAVFASFQKIDKNNRNTIKLFWEHSFVCGLAAKIIANHLHQPQSELFVAGLIHDIGKMAMLSATPQEYFPFLQPPSLEHFGKTARENEVFAITHDQIGMRLLKRWLFPESLIVTVGYHHQPHSAPSHALNALIVQLADILSLIHGQLDKATDEEILEALRNLLPDLLPFWQEKGFVVNVDDVHLWYQELIESRQRDGVIIDILTST
jgi:putative nucleotidyltransferase with HDIG domain